MHTHIHAHKKANFFIRICNGKKAEGERKGNGMDIPFSPYGSIRGYTHTYPQPHPPPPTHTHALANMTLAEQKNTAPSNFSQGPLFRSR